MSGLDVHVRRRLGALELAVELEVAAGEVLAVAGPSGAGKTSVLRAVAGLLDGAEGHVACGEEVWLDTGRGIGRAPERRRVGYVFQDFALFPHLSARDNVAYGLRGRSRAERAARAEALLSELGAGAVADRRPGSLSGGERQRVALARALAADPLVLLLDEPLSALDARTRSHAARTLLDTFRTRPVPVLLVTHDFGEAALLGDRVAVLDAGRVVQVGDPAELAARPASGFVADLTGAVVLTGTAARAPGDLTAVTLDGGGVVLSTDAREGRVAASVHPWEVALAPLGAPATGSAQNRLEAEVRSLTTLGGRVRVGLAAGQPLAAEVTGVAAEALGLAPGSRVTASWKAAATRLADI